MRYRLILECDVQATAFRWPDDSTPHDDPGVTDVIAYVREHGKVLTSAIEVRPGMWTQWEWDE